MRKHGIKNSFGNAGCQVDRVQGLPVSFRCDSVAAQGIFYDLVASAEPGGLAGIMPAEIFAGFLFRLLSVNGSSGRGFRCYQDLPGDVLFYGYHGMATSFFSWHVSAIYRVHAVQRAGWGRG